MHTWNTSGGIRGGRKMTKFAIEEGRPELLEHHVEYPEIIITGKHPVFYGQEVKVAIQGTDEIRTLRDALNEICRDLGIE